MRTYAFIDASNLFYGGEKSLGWKIDYEKLLAYLKQKYGVRKANCDVEMTLRMVLEENNFNRAVVLSGDGDFLPVLRYLRKEGKEIVILSRGPRTAKEIRQFAGSNFRDFEYLRELLKMREK